MTSTENEYTSLDFLSKIRLQPKRNIFKHLSLDTDLEEINQVLSPKAQTPAQTPNMLDRDLTKRFFMQIITKYQGENEANSKWDGFLNSMNDAQSFQMFVQSLKEIKDEPKTESTFNPENQNGNKRDRSVKIGRSSSCKKMVIKEQKKESKITVNLKNKIREEVNELKDLLLAGEKFLREMVNDYS